MKECIAFNLQEGCRLKPNICILKSYKMQKVIFPFYVSAILMCIILFSAEKGIAQIAAGTYSSGYFVEMRWNPSKGDYEKMQTVELLSGFRFDKDGIAFKKGNSSNWLYNSWQYKGELAQKREVASDWYLDDRNQKIVIDYDNKTLFYYHEYDKGLKLYRRLTVYKNLKALDTIDTDEDDGDNEKFRVDMEYVSVYDAKTKKWSDWQEGFNSFVINYNNNGDILHIKGSGKQVIYRKISKGVERKRTEDGNQYQIIEVIDEDGDRCSFQIFDDYSIGIKIIYGNLMIQFSK